MKIYHKILGFMGAVSIFLCSFSQITYAVNMTSEQYWPAGPEIGSAAGIVMELNTGTVLYEKNCHDEHYPASITKILTALLAIENCDMNEVVTFSYDAVHKTEGSGIARDVDEQMTMEQCLYGLMLASANECAYAIGEHVAGDIQSFVNMMNEKAAELGCQNTHFNNANGLPDEQHYTSAYDMALIAREAYKNEAFRIICGTQSYTIPCTNKHTDEETLLHNHHQMLYPYRTRKYLYEYCTGGKTGYTVVANNTLVTYAEKDGMTLICVVLNAPGSVHYEDTRGLFDYGFDNFKLMNVSENEKAYQEKEQNKEGALGKYDSFVALDSNGSVVLPKAVEFSDTVSEIVFDSTKEDVLGTLQYTYAGRLVGGADITATGAKVEPILFQKESAQGESAGTSEEKDILQIRIKDIVGGILILLALILLIFLGWKFADNFYYIRRKFRSHKKARSPYKTIKKNRMLTRRRR